MGRKRKALDDQQPNGVPFKQAAQQFFCEICSVQLNSQSQASQRKEGKIHKVNATKRDLLNSVGLLNFAVILLVNIYVFPFSWPTIVNNRAHLFSNPFYFSCFTLT